MIVFPFDALSITTIRGSIRLSDHKKITAGYRTDKASVHRAGIVIEMLAEAGCGNIIDFRKNGAAIGGKGTPEIKGLLKMLREGRLDILITSARDIPYPLDDGFEIGAVPSRGNPYNVLISAEELILEEQPGDVAIVVPDPFNRAQLRYYRPDLLFVDMDCGVESLNGMMEEGKIGGFVVDAMEVESLSCQESVVEVFTSSLCMPAAGQGAMALVTRSGDSHVKSLVQKINHQPSWAEVSLERMFLGEIPGRGRKSAGALSRVEDDEFQISAVLVAKDGSERIEGTMTGWKGEEKTAAGKLVSQLLEAGGEQLIREH
jgi:hydroxymethylbilane synthase